jgi:hypothetical protein
VPHEQAAGLCQTGRAPREPSREGRYWLGPQADFGPVAREFKKNPFLFFIWFQTEFKL